MTDDLVKRAREWNFCWPSHDVEMLVPAMADRIEELEAKLAQQVEWVKRLADDLIAAEGREARLKDKLERVVEALGMLVRDCQADYPPSHGAITHFAIATLAELKGQKDE